MKIAVALSGGVDSSVAAMLLKEQGHELEGMTMSVYREGIIDSSSCGNACYGPDEKDDIETAAELCRNLGIPYHVFDCADEYEEAVLNYFKKEYLNGRTPNPCVRCNHLVKLGVLPEAAATSGLDFDMIATGHYARICRDPDSGRFYLLQAADLSKDQSYFLYRLSQQQLSKLLFPLGKLSKQEVLKIAADAGIAADDYEESQDFIAGDYKQLFRDVSTSGEIADIEGKILGRHSGLWNYTIGQRRGIGISSPEPLYVVRLDSETNRVVVGPKNALSVSTFKVSDIVWMKLTKESGPFEADVRIRSAGKSVPAEISIEEEGRLLSVTAHSTVNAVTPGQSAVFYDGSGAVLCGGIIV